MTFPFFHSCYVDAGHSWLFFLLILSSFYHIVTVVCNSFSTYKNIQYLSGLKLFLFLIFFLRCTNLHFNLCPNFSELDLCNLVARLVTLFCCNLLLSGRGRLVCVMGQQRRGMNPWFIHDYRRPYRGSLLKHVAQSLQHSLSLQMQTRVT